MFSVLYRDKDGSETLYEATAVERTGEPDKRMCKRCYAIERAAIAD